MKQLKNMKETLVSATQAQLANLQNANTEELGCAIDMIKDLSEAIYYCSIVKSMEEAQEEQKKGGGQQQQQQQQPPAMMYFREMYPYPYEKEREPNRMYYSDGGSSGPSSGGGRSGGGNSSMSSNSSTGSNQSGGNTRGYQEFEYQPNAYGGRSSERRRTYMESKHSNDKAVSLKELEHYAQDLTTDVVEMIEGATTEEKQMLAKKLTILANKIQNNTV